MNSIEQSVYDSSGVVIKFDFQSVTDFHPQRMYYYSIDGVVKDIRLPLYSSYMRIDFVKEFTELILDDLQQTELEF